MTWTYTITRLDSYDRQRCACAGDETQPCNPEGGTWLTTASMHHPSLGHREAQRNLCSNHLCRFMAEKGIPWRSSCRTASPS